MISKLPDKPYSGFVIRFAYLWRSEADKGRTEAVKDRPCAVVVATLQQNGKMIAYAAPITHTAPSDPSHAIEMPAATKQRLGLDEARSWVMTTELNAFTWPGLDLRPIPRRSPHGFVYGLLPRSMVIDLGKAVRQHIRSGKAAVIGRDEPDGRV